MFYATDTIKENHFVLLQDLDTYHPLYVYVSVRMGKAHAK